MFHPTQLLETDKHGRNWWFGPKFLYDNNKMWNTQTIETLDETNLEIRKAETFVAINAAKENILTHIQYGSWSKMIRVIGWVLGICFNLKARKLKVGNHAWSPDNDGIIESRKNVSQINSIKGVQ